MLVAFDLFCHLQNIIRDFPNSADGKGYEILVQRKRVRNNVPKLA